MRRGQIRHDAQPGLDVLPDAHDRAIASEGVVISDCQHPDASFVKVSDELQVASIPAIPIAAIASRRGSVDVQVDRNEITEAPVTFILGMHTHLRPDDLRLDYRKRQGRSVTRT